MEDDGSEGAQSEGAGVGGRDRHEVEAKTKPEGEGDGVEVEMLNTLAANLNFTFDLTTKPPDEKWGYFENGSWTGMLGMVYNGDKNFTVNYFGYTNKRIEDFDASVSYWMEGFGLALLKPQPFPKWRSVYYPFTPVDLAQDKPVLGSLGHVWLYVLRPVLSHALPRLPMRHSQRVFIAAWWLACLILTTAYTANLIAFLTIPLYPKQLQTVEQLAKSNYRSTVWPSYVTEPWPKMDLVDVSPDFCSLKNRRWRRSRCSGQVFTTTTMSSRYVDVLVAF
ncbi:hypothetical protein O3P69_020868 [Scylla paramamosain]|uniref:Ionotropic glutamate receptor L-glutamate and glycine-binding domain-containing protein n=1 Tax=Scylla paramamosain TaxID=85552 RepID=A0AAW0TPH2_SCYPA